MSKQLMKGNEALAEAALRAGCRFYSGYPITPQTEILEYLAKRMDEVGGTFVQTESELAGINMLLGAAAAGARALTSSAGPGFSLNQEGISYLVAADLPAVIINVMRIGTGLGDIAQGQGDYWQMTRGGGHGDYKLLTYAPSTVQEAVDILYYAFDKADEYRTPVCILGDGLLGQIMEPVTFPEMKEMPDPSTKSWAVTGTHHGKDKTLASSIYIDPNLGEAQNNHLVEKFERIAQKETQCEEFMCDDAEIILTGYGSVGRIIKSAIYMLREKGIKAGLVRPITLMPFPTKVYEKYAAKASVKRFLTVELSMGQFVEDVKLSVMGKKPVDLFTRCGGNIMTPEDVVEKVMEVK